MRIPTLYHGTVRVNAKSLRSLVRPRIGPTVARAYGTEHAGFFRALFFATDDPLNAASFAVMAIEEQSPNPWKSSGPLPWDELPTKGAVAVFENPSPDDWKHCEPHGHECDDYTAEPGDWYTPYELKPTRVLVGKALMTFLYRHGYKKPSEREDRLLRENRA